MAGRVGSHDDFAQNIPGTVGVKDGQEKIQSNCAENVANEKVAGSSDAPHVGLHAGVPGATLLCVWRVCPLRAMVRGMKTPRL